MKGLYKKISAIVLAGMVVFGGVALGGVQKADASVGFLVGISEDSKRDYEFVKYMCHLYDIQIIKSSKDSSVIDKFVRKEFPKVKRLLKNEKEFKSEQKAEFDQYLRDIRKGGMKGAKKFHRVKFADREYVLLLR